MNVIVIVTDSMRADHLGCHPLCTVHSGKRVQTPNLDRLAGEGTLFEQAYGGSLPTIPMRTDSWTGRYGSPFHGWAPFPEKQRLLAEVLWDRGYTSALVTDVYHMHKPGFNYGRGFDKVAWVRGQEYDPWIVDSAVPIDLNAWHRLKHGDTPRDGDDLWRPRFEQYLRNRSTIAGPDDCFVKRVVNEATQWLEQTVRIGGQRDRLFLWVDSFDPHEPWDPPEPYWSMYAEKPDAEVQPLIDPVPGPPEGYVTDEEIRRTFSLYAGLVTCVDKWVGDLLACIRSLGLYENSLIVHISDHGEPFNEHGIVRKACPWLYEELTHVPWTIRHPGGIGSGLRSQAFAQPADLMPTILDFLDVPASAADPMHGQSLLPLMRGEKDAIREHAFSGMGGQWSIRSPEWTYLLPVRAAASRFGRPELYNRRTDIREQHDVIGEHPDVAEALELALRRWVAERGGRARHSPPNSRSCGVNPQGARNAT